MRFVFRLSLASLLIIAACLALTQTACADWRWTGFGYVWDPPPHFYRPPAPTPYYAPPPTYYAPPQVYTGPPKCFEYTHGYQDAWGRWHPPERRVVRCPY